MAKLKVIIAGGRDFDDEELMNESLHRFPGILFMELVCGRCDTGADAMGYTYFRSRGRTVHEFPADWKPADFGGRIDYTAGPRRNTEMAKFADVLIAFWDGKSKGTRDMINKALKHGLEIHVYRY